MEDLKNLKLISVFGAGRSTLVFAAVLLLGACKESGVVDVGPKTEKRLQEGQEAREVIEKQKAVLKNAERLEDELENTIEKSRGVEVVANRSSGFKISASGECMMEIRQDGLLSSYEFPQLLRLLIETDNDRPECKTVIIIAQKVVIPQGEYLSTKGRNLVIVADVVELYGTITTEGLPVKANQPGRDGGDVKIYTLELMTGAGARIITAGSRAGAFDPDPAKLSKRKIEALRRDAIKKGISFNEKPGKQKLMQFKDAPSASLARAYNEIEPDATEYMQLKHPTLRHRAPNPFAGKLRVITTESRKYFWKVYQRPIEVTAVATDRLKIVVPAHSPDETIPGGQPGDVIIRVASPKDRPQINSVQEPGEMSKAPKQVRAAWDIETLSKSFEVSSRDKIEYTFELWSYPNNNSKATRREKTWSKRVSAGKEKQTVRPKIVYEIRKREPQSTRTDAFVEKASLSSEDAQNGEQKVNPVQFELDQAALDFIDEALMASGISTMDLPQGLAKYSDWSKDWQSLEAKAKDLGIRLR